MGIVASLLILSIGAPPLLLDRAASAIDPRRLEQHVIALQSAESRTSTSGGTRVSGRLGEAIGFDHVRGIVAGIGVPLREERFVVRQVFDPSGHVESLNLVATIAARAGAEAQPRLVLVAHADSKAANDATIAAARGWRWREHAAPGADDNASGTAALLEVLRALAALPPPARPVDVVWAGAEEMAIVDPGWWMVNIGGEVLVEGYLRRSEPVLGAISVDMLLRPRPWGAALRVYSDGRWRSARLAVDLEEAAWLVAPELTLRHVVEPAFPWSDHGSFWQRELGGVLLIEDDFHHARYHTTADLYAPDDDFYDLRQLTAGARVVAAAAVLSAWSD